MINNNTIREANNLFEYEWRNVSSRWSDLQGKILFELRKRCDVVNVQMVKCKFLLFACVIRKVVLLRGCCFGIYGWEKCSKVFVEVILILRFAYWCFLEFSKINFRIFWTAFAFEKWCWCFFWYFRRPLRKFPKRCDLQK